MTTQPVEPKFLPRDGTSQAGRVLAALDPEYARVDERTIQDMVRFARELGKGLVYHGLDDRPQGTWSDFIGSLEPEMIAAFLEHPERFDPRTRPELFRPHFVLFLTFLKLYQRAQGELNTLTARHLDFYYRRVLQMGRKGPVPDRVHLLFDLARGERDVLVPAGSLLGAGPDSLGREQVYRTERAIIVNRVKIAKKSTVFVERKRSGLRQVVKEAGDDPEAACLAMLELVLGDPLPAYPGGEPGGAEVGYKELDILRKDMEASPLLADVRIWIRQQQVSATTTGLQALAEHGEAASLIEAKAERVRALDGYFHMRAESFVLAMNEVKDQDVKDWENVFSILEDAHRKKSQMDRIKQLRMRHTGPPAADVMALIRYVLDRKPSEGDKPDLMARLKLFLGERDFAELEKLEKPTTMEWPRVYSLLEVAQRNRLGERPAEKVEWINLHSQADAAVEGARPVLEGQDGSPRWATFGLARPATSSSPPSPVLGWAISSPLLWLREGERAVTLTLGFCPFPGGQELLSALLQSSASALPATHPLLFQISTAMGWVDCLAVTVDVGAFSTLSATARSAEDLLGVRIHLTLETPADPIVPLSPKLTDIDSPWPVLRLMLRPTPSSTAQPHVIHYPALANLSLQKVHVRVRAGGLAALSLRNDDGVLDPKKPFEPFGQAPSVGSRLLIGHPEACGKNLDTLAFHLQWMGDPTDLSVHYENYTLDSATRLVNAENLSIRLAMVDRGQNVWCPECQMLVEDSGTAFLTTIHFDVEMGPVNAARLTRMSAALGEDVSTWSRYLQWELTGSDFGHSVYPAIAASKAVDLAIAIAAGAAREAIEPSRYKVNPPYTPRLKSLTLDYTSSQEINLADPLPAPGEQSFRIFHVHPFGHCEIHTDLDGTSAPTGVPFLPRYDNDGELYLGLEGVAAPQSVCLLFQLAEGSADPDLPRPRVDWSYLDGDRWIPCAHRVLQDTTSGLLGSGIVELALDPVAPSTRLRGGGLYWIRAALARDTAAVCDTLEIHPQAVSAVFVDHDNAPDRFGTPLPAGTLKKLTTRVRGIAGVRQPYTSHGGRMAEDSSMWATRVSERLRHKQRALSTWDYERLVLERFPEIYKARCLPARKDAPGKVEIVVIPDIRRLKPSDPFEPKAPSSLLAEIEAYLRDKTPAFVTVKVRNPRYVHVRVRLAVRFASEGNDDFYKRQLNDDLNRFLSPWAFDEGEDITLNGKIYANSLIDFVDRRDYVDYVAGVKLFTSRDGGARYQPADDPDDDGSYFVDAKSADVVLVAARSHVIHVLHDAVYEEERMSGIGYMMVDLDLQVAPPPSLM